VDISMRLHSEPSDYECDGDFCGCHRRRRSCRHWGRTEWRPTLSVQAEGKPVLPEVVSQLGK
jgi:predicted nucleic acid binding AN1-type Zn finger protein